MSKDINKKLGKRIKELRKIKGFSKEKFAEAIDIATNSLSLIETGNGFMTLATLDRMCKALEVEPYEIFKFHEDVNTQEMYEYLKRKVEFIKEDEAKLRSAYSFFQNLI